jgi:hypothetical protein
MSRMRIKQLRLTASPPRAVHPHRWVLSISPQTDASRNALSTAFILVCHRLPCARYQAKTSASNRSAICSFRSLGFLAGRPRFERSSATPRCAVASSQNDSTPARSFGLYGNSDFRVFPVVRFLLMWVCLSTRNQSWTVSAIRPYQHDDSTL